jgi:uncharacterized protein YndB with AHSA1/START domain
MDKFIARQSISILTSAAKVWDALINPVMIKQYLFGTEVTSDWQAGSRITYRGVWNGKAYEDKGKVLNIIPEKLIESTFWSSLEGLPDVPENYKKVVYEIKPGQDGVKLTVTQDNNATEEDKTHSEENWKMVLTALKTLLEK